MILDCRRSNHWFNEPEPVKLTTGESLRRIQLLPDEKLYVCNADAANAFYTLSMPEEIRDYFCLKPVCARDLGLTEIGKKPVKPGQKVFPRLAVLPMGWTWALYWCQRAHEAVVERSGLKSEERLQDFSPVPRGNFWHSYALAALTFFHPQLKGKEMMPLSPLSLQGLRGWRRLCPPRSRMPVPYEVVALLSVVALERGLWEVAIVMLLNFFLYLRPAEYQRLRVCNIVRPARRSHQALQFWGVLLNPTELGVPSKTMGRGTELGPEDSCASGFCHEQSALFWKPAKARLGLQCEVNRSEWRCGRISDWRSSGNPTYIAFDTEVLLTRLPTSWGKQQKCNSEVDGSQSAHWKTTRREDG